MQNSPSSLEANPSVVYRDDLSDGGVLYHPGTDRAYKLNRFGVRIWMMVREQQSREQIITRLRASLSPDLPDSIEDDVDEFLTSLLDHDLATGRVDS